MYNKQRGKRLSGVQLQFKSLQLVSLAASVAPAHVICARGVRLAGCVMMSHAAS